jgi:hypothetical protein
MKQQQRKQQNQAKPTPVPTQAAQHTPSAPAPPAPQGRGTIPMPQTAPANQAQPPQATQRMTISTANNAGKQEPESEAGQQPAPRTHTATAQHTRSSTLSNTNQSTEAGTGKQHSKIYTALAAGCWQESGATSPQESGHRGLTTAYSTDHTASPRETPRTHPSEQ